MAKEGHRIAELLSSLVSALVAASLVNDMLVFLQMRIDIGKEFLRQVKFRQDRVLVNLETCYLLCDFQCVGNGLRMLIEHIQHLVLALEVLLLGISHTVRVRKI